MFSNVEFSLLFGKISRYKSGRHFQDIDIGRKPEQDTSLRKLSSGVALRCGPEGFLRER